MATELTWHQFWLISQCGRVGGITICNEINDIRDIRFSNCIRICIGVDDCYYLIIYYYYSVWNLKTGERDENDEQMNSTFNSLSATETNVAVFSFFIKNTSQLKRKKKKKKKSLDIIDIDDGVTQIRSTDKNVNFVLCEILLYANQVNPNM